MKKFALCIVAALLATGALMSKPAPAYACTMFPACAENGCPDGKICDYCSGRCR
jgi:hypothetical protein